MDETRQQGGCGPLAEARQAWNAVGVVAGQSEIIRNRVRPDPAALQQRLLVEHALADHVDLHHVVGLQALPEVLVRREDPHLVDLPGIPRGSRGERIVGFEFAHRPHHRADRARGLFRGVELRAQVRWHPLVGLVVREEVVAERTDELLHLVDAAGNLLHRRIVDPAIGIDYLGDRGLDLIGIADVAHHAECRAAGGLDVRDDGFDIAGGQ